MSLTIQVIIKNNEKTLKECIESLLKINGIIKIIDIGSSDNSVSICEELNLEVIKKSLNNDYSKLRNDNIEGDWFIWIKPWEKIISGWEELNLITSQTDFKKCFDFKIINQNIVSRDIRLWHKDLNIKFKNNAFETPDCNKSIMAENVILSEMNHKIDIEETKEIFKKWHEMGPFNPEISYYEANFMLSIGKYQEFINFTDHYFHSFSIKTNDENVSNIMMRYNLAQIQIYHKNDINEGIRNLLQCILYNPSISEFWCLLGDAFYKIKEFQKAISFYENAIIIGSKRELDFFPVDITKYKDYPNKMIESCERIINETKVFLHK